MPKMFAVEVDKTIRKYKCMSFIMNFIIFDNEYATVPSYDEKRMHLWRWFYSQWIPFRIETENKRISEWRMGEPFNNSKKYSHKILPS